MERTKRNTKKPLDVWEKTIALADISQIRNEWAYIEKHAGNLWFYFVLLPFQTQIEMLSYISQKVQIQLFSELFSQDVHKELWYKTSHGINAHNRSNFTLYLKEMIPKEL